MAGTKDTAKIRATAMVPKAVMAAVLLADTANKVKTRYLVSCSS